MVCCFYCCHEIETTPLHMPISYDENTDTFLTKDCFCSWECMKSHNLLSNDFLKNNRFELIQLMYKKETGKHNKIKFAPKRENLEMFGGSMNISDFRHSSTTILHHNVNINQTVAQSDCNLKLKKGTKKGFNLAESMGLLKV